MRNTKSAFTLVELIVVITILAILGTIAFISLQGYSADARNSKRTSDIGNIQSAMSLKMVEGVPVMSFITADPLSQLTTPSIGWASTIAGEYSAGTPAYSVLNVAAKDFKDPNDKEYRIGATTLKAGAFQIAASMEVDGIPTAQVNGTYVARGTGAVDTKTIASVDTKTITLADANANFFKVNDTVVLSGSGSQTIKVQKVSRDGVTLTFASAVTTGTGTIKIAVDEPAGLIKAIKGTALGTPVTNLSTTALAY